MDYPKGITPSGAGLRIRLFSGGRCVYTETIKCDPASKAAVLAASKRRDWLLARQKLGLPLYEDDDSARQTFGRLAAEFLEVADMKASSRATVESHLRRYWKPLNHLPADEVTERDIRKALALHDTKNKTKQNALDSLRSVFNYSGLPNPAAFRMKKDQAPAIARYRPDERDKILSKLEGQARVYFTLLFATGLRPGEALALRWADYEGGFLHVHRSVVRRQLVGYVKNNLRRKVYVPEWARPALLAHTTRFSGGFIFQQRKNSGEYYRTTKVLNAAWKAAHEKARLPYRVPYACRHTRAAELLSTGVMPAKAAKQMGHSMEVFLRIYSELIEEYCSTNDWSEFEGAKAADKSTDKNPRETSK